MLDCWIILIPGTWHTGDAEHVSVADVELVDQWAWLVGVDDDHLAGWVSAGQYPHATAHGVCFLQLLWLRHGREETVLSWQQGGQTVLLYRGLWLICMRNKAFQIIHSLFCQHLFSMRKIFWLKNYITPLQYLHRPHKHCAPYVENLVQTPYVFHLLLLWRSVVALLPSPVLVSVEGVTAAWWPFDWQRLLTVGSPPCQVHSRCTPQLYAHIDTQQKDNSLTFTGDTMGFVQLIRFLCWSTLSMQLAFLVLQVVLNNF